MADEGPFRKLPRIEGVTRRRPLLSGLRRPFCLTAATLLRCISPRAKQPTRGAGLSGGCTVSGAAASTPRQGRARDCEPSSILEPASERKIGDE